MRQHPTTLLLWALAGSLLLWAAIAVIAPHPFGWDSRTSGAFGSRMMASGRLLAGPGGTRSMHSWGGRSALYISNPNGGAPEISDVKQALGDWLTWEGNARLKLGAVIEKDANTFQADIVTKDGSLAQRFEIDRRSGQLQAVED
jgi:hypothetical protein